jgi:hypothetical protein
VRPEERIGPGDIAVKDVVQLRQAAGDRVGVGPDRLLRVLGLEGHEARLQ